MAAEVPKFSAELDNLYRRSLVIDALAGVTDDNGTIKPLALQQALESGVTGINWTVSQTDFEGTVANIANIHSLAENDPAHWMIVRKAPDLPQAKRDGKIAVILGFQYPQPIEDLDHLETFHQLGVRVMQLTYNNRSLMGDGCLEPGNAGLSKLGKAAIAKMNQLGIAVDLSHSGQRTTAEGIEASTKPVLITHSGCNAVFEHPRNKNDKDMRALADRGGVIWHLLHAVPGSQPNPAGAGACSKTSRPRFESVRRGPCWHWQRRRHRHLPRHTRAKKGFRRRCGAAATIRDCRAGGGSPAVLAGPEYASSFGDYRGWPHQTGIFWRHD